ncbi:hypothetical protein TOPH_05947 [Tolypocladium ophioglossoides CBS 100239]|uniref:Uncharacterized protein n=1 Tax=Tolypocladium ophioglossoides (strain CBS 100239) TaxID=1163406 RepID=A0A0L0N665_TOLOC|nr:hypothetical protein TOPH_05947 [Tolypocladium ophioglossoides CBS 100239]
MPGLTVLPAQVPPLPPAALVLLQGEAQLLAVSRRRPGVRLRGRAQDTRQRVVSPPRVPAPARPSTVSLTRRAAAVLRSLGYAAALAQPRASNAAKGRNAAHDEEEDFEDEQPLLEPFTQLSLEKPSTSASPRAPPPCSTPVLR